MNNLLISHNYRKQYYVNNSKYLIWVLRPILQFSLESRLSSIANSTEGSNTLPGTGTRNFELTKAPLEINFAGYSSVREYNLLLDLSTKILATELQQIGL